MPGHATSPAELETAARSAVEETTAAISDGLKKLQPFMDELRQRVTLALQLAQANKNALPSGTADEVPELARLLAAVGAEMPRAHEIGSKLKAFLLLAQNRGNHSNPAEVDRAVTQLAGELQAVIDGIQERLRPFTYPFPHARGRLTAR